MKLEVNGLENVLKKLNSVNDKVKDRRKATLETIAKIGAKEAERLYGLIEKPEGVNDVKVEPTEISADSTSIKVVASGHAVTFLEFGAGVYYNGLPGIGAPYGFVIGEYGRKRGRNKGWYYSAENGHKTYTHGNLPSRSMFYAGEKMRDSVGEVVKEVFFGD